MQCSWSFPSVDDDDSDFGLDESHVGLDRAGAISMYEGSASKTPNVASVSLDFYASAATSSKQGFPSPLQRIASLSPDSKDLSSCSASGPSSALSNAYPLSTVPSASSAPGASPAPAPPVSVVPRHPRLHLLLLLHLVSMFLPVVPLSPCIRFLFQL